MTEAMAQNLMMERPMLECNASHIALSLVLDVSGSMSGAPIQALNDGVNQMVQQLAADEKLGSIVDLSIVKFSDTADIFLGWTPIAEVPKILLTTENATIIAPALRMSVDMVADRCHKYELYAPCYKPWIIVLSDGGIMDNVDLIGSEIIALDKADKLRCFALGVGNFQPDILHKFTDRVLALNGYNFVDFFSWVGKSLRTVSSKGVSDSARLPAIPQTIFTV